MGSKRSHLTGASLLFGLCLIQTSQAKAEFKFSSVSILALATLSKPSITVDSASSGLSYSTTPQLSVPGYGVLLEFELSKSFSLETGGRYFTRKADVDATSSGGSVKITEETTWIEVPAQLKYQLFSNFFLAGGVYAALGSGEVKQTDRASGTTVTGSFADAGKGTFEYGVLASLGFKIPLSQSIGLTLEGGLRQGLNDLSVVTDTSLHYADSFACAGLRFQF